MLESYAAVCREWRGNFLVWTPLLQMGLAAVYGAYRCHFRLFPLSDLISALVPRPVFLFPSLGSCALEYDVNYNKAQRPDLTEFSNKMKRKAFVKCLLRNVPTILLMIAVGFVYLSQLRMVMDCVWSVWNDGWRPKKSCRWLGIRWAHITSLDRGSLKSVLMF